jgi:hypothetical protein
MNGRKWREGEREKSTWGGRENSERREEMSFLSSSLFIVYIG